MMWQVPSILWRGGDVWIIGGGSSIPIQFGIPEEIRKDVAFGRQRPDVYSPYMESIQNKHVIGINVAYMLGDWVDMVFFGDSNFFLKHEAGLAKFPNIRVSCAPKTRNVDWVKHLQKNRKKRIGISDNPGMVSWNYNSGAAAINVAANAGAKRIVLLGFDMSLAVDDKQHWHNVYGSANRKLVYKKGKIVNMPFHTHLRGFPAIARDAKRRGIEILNASPTSAIDCFRKVSVKDLL